MYVLCLAALDKSEAMRRGSEIQRVILSMPLLLACKGVHTSGGVFFFSLWFFKFLRTGEATA